MAFFNRLVGDIDEMRDEGKISVGGVSFLTHLLSTYWGVRGIPETMVDLVLPAFLSQVLNTPSGRGQQLSSLVFTPWAMKPLFALCSDIFPIMHYKKRFHMVTVTAVAILACGMLATLSAKDLGGPQANTAFVFFFLIHTGIAMCDSLTQGKYTEICKAKGASIVTFVSGSKVLAGVLAAIIAARLNDTDPRITLWVHVPFFTQAAIVQFLNFMGDARREDCCSPDIAVVKKDYKIVTLGLTLGILALCVPFVEDAVIQLIFAIVVVVICLSLTFWALPPTIAKINVYILFCRMATLDFRYPLYQWYTATSDVCSPDEHPNFNNTTYQAVGLVCGNLATLFGVYLFEKYVSHWNVRQAFWVTTVFTVVAALFDLSMLTGFNRWLFAPLGFGNINPFGMGRLDDLLGFLLGTQALKPIATTLDDMPATVLLSKLCPVGVETTVFAILAALQNIGMQVSGLMGAQVIKKVGFNIQSDPTKTECNTGRADALYGPAWMNGITYVVVIGSILLPLTTIPATFILLPNRRLDEDFTDEGGNVEMEAAPRQGTMNDETFLGGALNTKSPSLLIDETSTASKIDRERGSMVTLTRGTGSRLM